jgi:hypothetical protein
MEPILGGPKSKRPEETSSVSLKGFHLLNDGMRQKETLMRTFAAIGALLVAGCGGGSSNDSGIPNIPTIQISPPSLYAFDVFVHNYDATPYSVYVEWQDTTSGTWKAFRLFTLPAAPSGSSSSDSAIYYVTPGVPYYLVIADETGYTLIDSLQLGTLSVPTYLPIITPFSVQGARLTKVL